MGRQYIRANRRRKAEFDRQYEAFKRVDDLLAWLPQNSDPDLWHLLVGNLNYDYDATWDVVLWIVGQPQCSRATAVLALAAIEVQEYARFDRPEDGPHFLTRAGWLIGQTVCERGTGVSTFVGPEFNLTCVHRRNDLGAGVLSLLNAAQEELAAQGRQLPWPIPTNLLGACTGRDAVSELYVVNDDILYRRRGSPRQLTAFA